MKRIHWLLLGLVTLAGCAKQSSSPNGPDVLATIGTRPIRVADLEAEAARRAALGQAVPAKETLLEELVTREAMLERALELGLAEQPEVRRRYQNLLLAELKERELQPRLAQAKVSPESLRAAGASVTRLQPAQVRLAVLRFGVSSRTSAEKRTQLAERLAEAREKASRLSPDEAGFGALAVDYSDDQSTRYCGGDLGWFSVGRTNYSVPAEVLSAGQALTRVGEVSEVLRTEDGFFLVRLMERREAGKRSAGESDAVLHHKLLAQERKRIEAEFGAEARSRARVEINTQALAAVQLDFSRPMAHAEAPAHPPALP
jgi:parvulin-like peptidyl-prolyl isomerase